MLVSIIVLLTHCEILNKDWKSLESSGFQAPTLCVICACVIFSQVRYSSASSMTDYKLIKRSVGMLYLSYQAAGAQLKNHVLCWRLQTTALNFEGNHAWAGYILMTHLTNIFVILRVNYNLKLLLNDISKCFRKQYALL